MVQFYYIFGVLLFIYIEQDIPRRIVSVSFSVISVNVRRIRYIPLGLKLQLTIHSIGIFNLEMDRSCQMIDRNLK